MSNNYKQKRIKWALVWMVLASGLLLWWGQSREAPDTDASAAGGQQAAVDGGAARPGGQTRPALTVSIEAPQTVEWPQRLAIDGNVVAWQEAVIGAELGQLRISEVLVQVGDRVKKGQLLARLDDATSASDFAEAEAAVAEAEAAAEEAHGNAERAKALGEEGFYSPQLYNQYRTVERTATARLNAARARLTSARLRLQRTRIAAPDDGVISARSATVGSLSQPGQELFRLIRGGRLEWQAELAATQLGEVRVGAPALISVPGGGEPIQGKVRSVAPSIDPRTRNGIVYVDLPADGASAARAGMFARGEIDIGSAPALTVREASLVMHDGYSYVYTVASRTTPQQQVRLTKVDTGRRQGARIEIVSGLTPDAQVVVAGAGFLTDGDLVSLSSAEGEGGQ